MASTFSTHSHFFFFRCQKQVTHRNIHLWIEISDLHRESIDDGLSTSFSLQSINSSWAFVKWLPSSPPVHTSPVEHPQANNITELLTQALVAPLNQGPPSRCKAWARSRSWVPASPPTSEPPLMRLFFGYVDDMLEVSVHNFKATLRYPIN